MSAFPSLEKSLDNIFVKELPGLPKNVIEFIVKYLPYINLFLGVLTLLAALSLWQWAHVANSLIDYANSVSKAYGGSTISTSRMSFVLWLSLITLFVEAAIYIIAFAPTKMRKKSGWDLLFYALLINVVYGVLMIFGRGIGDLFMSILGTAIGLYFLFQIRSSYHEAPVASAAAPEPTALKPAKAKAKKSTKKTAKK